MAAKCGSMLFGRKWYCQSVIIATSTNYIVLLLKHNQTLKTRINHMSINTLLHSLLFQYGVCAINSMMESIHYEAFSKCKKSQES